MTPRSPAPPTEGLGRRERQLVEVVYRLGRASVGDVLASLPDPPSYSSVRKMLALLEEKGHVKHTLDGMRYIYTPVVRHEVARRSALRHMIETFFDGSEEELVMTLVTERRLSDSRLARLTRVLEEARERQSASTKDGGAK